MQPPDLNDPDGRKSPHRIEEKKKSWAEIVHDDIKKVTQEEVDRMAEAFETEKKKWKDGLNVVKSDYGIRRSYIEQLRDMQTKEKKEELKYNIMKITRRMNRKPRKMKRTKTKKNRVQPTGWT